ncbi:MAG: hypothetical protein CMK59_07900 [Proteobacteria bacterium]|nr:hypothetical protein [Pseudomonadota bacterium]
MNELLKLTALEQASLLVNKKISSVELCKLYLQQIADHNKDLGAFVSVQTKRALLRARRADRHLRTRNPTPVFCGVPIGIKDLFQTRFSRTRFGSRHYRYYLPFSDHEGVKRLKAGGFVSLGKLSTSEFGVMPITETALHPPTRNPWNLNHSAGGSSGGSGAAVAGNLVPIALGSDGAGSIRIPASFCHLFGFKPSLSLLGNLHGKNNIFGMSVMGPLSKDVADAAAMLDVLMGHIHSHKRPCWNATQCRPRSLNINLVVESHLSKTHPQAVSLTHTVAQTLESLGHNIQMIELDKTTISEFLPIWQYLISNLPIYISKNVEPVTAWLHMEGKKHTLEACLKLQQKLSERIERSLNNADLLLSPTVAMPAPLINEHKDEDPEQMFFNVAPIGAFTVPFNLIKGPSANLPMGLTANKMPIGIQLGGRPGFDYELLSLCAQLERALPWRTRFLSN